MIDVFKHYFTHCLDEFSPIMLVLLVLYVLLAILIGFFKGRKLAYGLMLFGWCMLLLYLTVFSRPTGEIMTYCLLPFSSYSKIANGDVLLLPQVFMNVLVFIPVGFLLKGFLVEWDWIKVVLYGTLFSIAIELLQLMLFRGAAEVDDVIHNTLGGIIGVQLFIKAHNFTKRIHTRT